MPNLIPRARSSLIAMLVLFLGLGGVGCKMQVQTNPSIVTTEDQASPPVLSDMTSPVQDLQTPPDLTSPPNLNDLSDTGDLTLPGALVCHLPAPGGNVRRCAMDGTSSGRCDGDFLYTADRTCTSGACSGGYCSPPQSPKACTSDADCARLSPWHTCQTFRNFFGLVTDANLQPVFYCAPPPGLKDQFEPCTKDSDCAWNLCYRYAQGPRCAKLCATDADCGGTAGSCGPQTVSFETQGTATPENFYIRACNRAP